jgi:hypothetical protein
MDTNDYSAQSGHAENEAASLGTQFNSGITLRDRAIDACTNEDGTVDWERVNNAVYDTEKGMVYEC